MDEEREWRQFLDHVAQGDDEEIALDAETELESVTLRKPPWHFDVRSAFVERPGGELIDRDDLVGPSDSTLDPDR